MLVTWRDVPLPTVHSLARIFCARSEQGTAHAHLGRAASNGQLEVVTHAYRQGVDAEMLRAQRIEQCAHAAEGIRALRAVGCRRGYRHQPAQGQTRCLRDKMRKPGSLIRRAAGFAGFVVDIDLDEHIQWRQRGRARGIQQRHQLGAIETFQPVEMPRDLAALVGLQRADQVPSQGQIGQFALLGQGLLHVVFAEVALPTGGEGAHGAGRPGLGHGEQSCRWRRRHLRGGDTRADSLKRDTPGVQARRLLRQRGGGLYSNLMLTMPPRAVGGGSRMDIAELLAFSVKNKASDLHLSAGLPPMIRVDGDVRRINVPALEHKQVHALIYDIMSDKQRRDYEEFLEVDFSFEIAGLARFRVNAFNQNRGAAAVFRTIPSEVWTLEDLGAPKIFKDLIDQPQGLILCTGPTGSGKSTTLAAMVDYVNKNNYGHILTIEDPIEFVHTSQKCLINQREVHRDTHGFNEALRSALREDPDFILVGEMRDIETIRLALTAAETGHLVFATLHTSSAAKTIDRIIDVFPAGEKPMVRSMLSESLRAVVAQSLLKKVGGGRIAAHEIMVGIPAIRNLIREDKVAQMYSSIQTGQQYGMQTMDQCLQDMVKRGSITRQNALEYAKNKDIFRA